MKRGIYSYKVYEEGGKYKCCCISIAYTLIKKYDKHYSDGYSDSNRVTNLQMTLSIEEYQHPKMQITGNGGGQQVSNSLHKYINVGNFNTM